MPNTGHRGHRAARRAADRRRRNWIVAAAVGAVLVIGLGGFAGALVLAGDGTAESTADVPGSTPPTSAASVVGVTVTTTSPLTCRAGLTPDAPLRLWIAGDSIAYSVGNGLGKKAANTGVVAPVYESRVSSGLSSPGFFDWPDRVDQELGRLDPEIVVFVMGTNDWAVPEATPVDSSGAPAWKAAYTADVEDMVSTLTADGRTLYWVGPPVLRDRKQEAGAVEIAAVTREVVDRHPSAVFVDAHALFADADGSYTASVEIDDERVTVRSGDGVHLSTEGSDYVGAALFDRLDAQCGLKAQAVSGVKQPLVETQGSTSVAPGSTATAPPVGTSPPTVAATSPPTAPPVVDTTPPATDPPATTPEPSTPATNPAASQEPTRTDGA